MRKSLWKYSKQIIDVIEAWQDWVLNSTDENMFSIFPCTSTQNTTFSIAGQYFGTEAETKTIVQKLIDNTPSSIQPNFYAYMPFVSAVRYNDGEPGQSSFKDTSGFTKSVLDTNAVKEIYKWLSNSPSANCLLQMDSFGRAINNLSPSATAFPHRNMNFIYQFQAYWDSPDDQKKHENWVDNFSKEIRTQFMEDACYRNYGDVTLSDWQYKYYANNYAKLQQIKQKYDPKDYFKYSQSIELPA